MTLSSTAEALVLADSININPKSGVIFIGFPRLILSDLNRKLHTPQCRRSARENTKRLGQDMHDRDTQDFGLVQCS
jgi:hypothetical protein